MNNIYSILMHSHSGLRYVVLALVLAAVANSTVGFIKNRNYNIPDKRIALIALASFHIQAFLGIVLYFFSPKVVFMKTMLKVELLRFFTIEHGLMMLISAVLITFGYSKAKAYANKNGHKSILIYYTIALLIVLWAIPWPFKGNLGGSWM